MNCNLADRPPKLTQQLDQLMQAGQYGFNRRDESRRFHNVVSNTDFDWYMRAV